MTLSQPAPPSPPVGSPTMVSHFDRANYGTISSTDNKDDDAKNDSSIIDYGFYGATTTTTTMPSPRLTVSYTREQDSVVDYGYCNDDTNAKNEREPLNCKMPRRSSLKCSDDNSSNPQQRRERRSSISYKGEIKVVLPGRRTVRRRISIGFEEEDKNAVKEIQPLTELGVDKADLWIAPEQAAINMQKAALVAEWALQFGAPSLCLRGLEGHLDANDARESIQAGHWTVLGEQDEQRAQGIFCDQAIGDVYAAAAAYSRDKAQFLAEEDYAAVADEHEQFWQRQEGGLQQRSRRASM